MQWSSLEHELNTECRLHPRVSDPTDPGVGSQNLHVNKFPGCWSRDHTLRTTTLLPKLQGWDYSLHFPRKWWQFLALSFALCCLHTAMSVCALHWPTFLLTCPVSYGHQREGGRSSEWKLWTVNPALPLSSYPGKASCVQSVLMQNGENKVSSLLLSQSTHTPPAQQCWAQGDF